MKRFGLLALLAALAAPGLAHADPQFPTQWPNINAPGHVILCPGSNGIYVPCGSPGALPLPVTAANPPAAADPCQGGQQKQNFTISQTASAQVITGVPSKKTYICSMLVIAADAENLSLVEGTGTTCGTGGAAVIGGTTAANGPNLAANGGWSWGSGVSSVAIASGAAGDNVCLFQSGSGRVAGGGTYVQQ